jgi:hypothetical protein
MMTQTDGRGSVNGSWLLTGFTKKVLWRDEAPYKVKGRMDTSLFIGVTKKKTLNFQKWQIGEEVRPKCDCWFLRKPYNGKQLSGTSAKHTDVTLNSTMTWEMCSFKEAIQLYLLLNKQHLFSRTRHSFILTRIVPLHACYMFRPVLGPTSGIPIEKPYKGR